MRGRRIVYPLCKDHGVDGLGFRLGTYFFISAAVAVTGTLRIS